MRKRRNVPLRERVFLQSLQYHGFVHTTRRKNLKKRKGYIIPGTQKEDSDGIDFWVKMPRDMRLLPVQITQRGIRHFREMKRAHSESLESFITKSNERIRKKQIRCFKLRIVFVLVRDYVGCKTSTTIAWGDVKAIRYAVSHLDRKS